MLLFYIDLIIVCVTQTFILKKSNSRTLGFKYDAQEPFSRHTCCDNAWYFKVDGYNPYYVKVSENNWDIISIE